MSTIIANIELDQSWSVFTDPKTGTTHLSIMIEEGTTEWLNVILNTPKRDMWDGTGHHNHAAVIIKNSEHEEEVSVRISVSDPRGGFVMESRVNETGHYLSVPHEDQGQLHADLEPKGRGFFKLKYASLKGDEEE